MSNRRKARAGRTRTAAADPQQYAVPVEVHPDLEAHLIAQIQRDRRCPRCLAPAHVGPTPGNAGRTSLYVRHWPGCPLLSDAIADPGARPVNQW